MTGPRGGAFMSSAPTSVALPERVSTPPAGAPPSRRTRSRARRRGPVDPRLAHYARGTRRYLIGTVLMGTVAAVLVVSQAWLIAATVARVVVGQEPLLGVHLLLVALLLVILGRAGTSWVAAR